MSKFRPSDWRQQDVVIPAGQNYDVAFLDTKPNVFWILNLNNITLYASLHRTPTVELHEYEIKPMKADVFGRPLPCSRLYLLNASNVDVTITIFSAYQEFDISILKDLNVAIDGESFKYDGMINGVKTGVTLPVSFPDGVTMEVENEELATIRARATEIRQYLENHWTDGTLVEKNSTALLTALNAVLTLMQNGVNVNNVVPDSGIYTGEYLSSTGTSNIVSDSNSIISFLTNDGETDILLTFTKDEDTKTLTLKSGESLENVYINSYSLAISPKNSGEAISYRYLISNRH